MNLQSSWASGVACSTGLCHQIVFFFYVLEWISLFYCLWILPAILRSFIHHKVHSSYISHSMIFIKFTQLNNCYHNPVLQHIQTDIFYPFCIAHIYIPTTRKPLICSLFVNICLTIDISYMWTHTVYWFFLTYFMLFLRFIHIKAYICFWIVCHIWIHYTICCFIDF